MQMLNYMKSEWYRITHTSTMYVFTGILAGMTLSFNLILRLFVKYEPGFCYGTVAFSLSNLTSNMFLMFVVGMIVVSLLFAGEKKSGVLKNAIAFGISREKVFIGKCVVSAVVSVCSLIAILLVYIVSAVLLLEPGVESDAIAITLKGAAAVLIMAVASEVLTIALLTYLDKEMIGYIWWYLIMVILPLGCRLIGLKIELFQKIAAWMPYNYLKNMNDETIINMSGWSYVWETPEGMMKCLISGMVALIVFLVLGLKICKKQEV